MKFKPYYPELQKSVCKTLEFTDQLTKLTKNLTQEVKLTLEGKKPIHYYTIGIPLCCMVFSNNYEQTETNNFLKYLLN